MTCIPAVVIPVFNHGGTLRAVAEGALRFCPLVIVVDDGSTDGGPDTLQGLALRLVRLPRNRGKGAALRAGASAAAELGATHVITLDADGQHDPADIPRFVAAIDGAPETVIVGSRDFAAANVPALSRFGRAFSGFWMRVQTGLVVDDMQSGYRAYPLPVFSLPGFRETAYAFEIEVLVRAAWAGYGVRCIPVAVRYPEPGRRISHFRVVRDNIRISLLNTRLTMRALLPVPFHASAGDAARVSWRRPLFSLRLLLKEDPPAQLGRSAGIAMFLSALPLPGVQTVLLLLAIGRLRLNRLCALAMIPLGWPPVVPGLEVFVGCRLRSGAWLTEFSVQTLGREAPERLLDWLAGGLALAPLFGIIAGAAVWAAAKGAVRLAACGGDCDAAERSPARKGAP